MTRNLDNRLRRLEAKTLDAEAHQIVIWCDDPNKVDAFILEIIKAGEISEADRAYCVHWEKAQPGPDILTHEDALKLLD